MGRKKNKGASTPYEAPINLQSAQRYKAVHAVSEGVLSGFGNETLLKSLYFNNTPVQSPSGSLNFKGVEVFATAGEGNQSYVPEFESSENTRVVGVEVKTDTPAIRTVSDPLINRLRVTVAVEQNIHINEKGDTNPTRTEMRVSLVNKHGHTINRQDVVFTERASGAYYEDVTFTTLPERPFTIEVRRLTPDAETTRTSNKTYFSSYVEVIDVKLSHPHTALLCVKMDSAQFGSSTPTVNVLVKGLAVRVPSNYNPNTREYQGIWDGSFKTEWTDNPAWILYDILTNPRYSTLARRLNRNMIDIWALYEVGKYCDELVDDGRGGKEPRFSCNVQLMDNSPRAAGDVIRDICSAFMGMGVWTGTHFSVFSDKAADPVYQYTNSNVIEGKFVYGSTSMKQVITAIHIRYADKEDGYRPKTEYVSDDAAVQRYGLNIKSVEAFGCTSRTQALRVGQWILNTNLMQQETVTFSVGREGLRHKPFDIIRVSDRHYSGAQNGGRIVSANGRTLQLDAEIQSNNGTLIYQTVSGSLHRFDLTQSKASREVVLPENAPEAAVNGVWSLNGGDTEPTLWRAINIKENTDEGTFAINAVRHDPSKYDKSEQVKPQTTRHTLHTLTPDVNNVAVRNANGGIQAAWDNSGAGGAATYDVWLYRNGKLHQEFFALTSPEVQLSNLPSGRYQLKVVGINPRGVRAEPVFKEFEISNEINALRTTAKTLAIDITWELPKTVAATSYTELWYASSNQFQAATKLATLPYPQNQFTLSSVSVGETYWFWARLVDNNGHAGEFTQGVSGAADTDPAPILAMVQGQITQDALSSSLISQLNESSAQQARAEANSVVNRVSNQLSRDLDTKARELNAKAQELGNKIQQVESLNQSQAQQIRTVTVTQQRNTAALEEERSARIAADRAESQARQTLANQVGRDIQAAVNEVNRTQATANQAQTERTEAAVSRLATAESKITTLQTTVTQMNQSTSTQISQLRASLDGLQVGGRNLLRNSGVRYQDTNYLHQYELTQAPKVGEAITCTIWGELGSGQTGWGIYNTQGVTELMQLVRVADGVYRATGVWKKPIRNGAVSTPNDTHLSVFAYPANVRTQSTIERIKLEIGNVGTDWTPAPEDVTANAQSVQADLDNYKQVQANANRVQTSEVTAAKSRLDTAEASIRTAQNTVSGLDGKVNSLYTVKVQAVGNRKAVAGVALGADGATGDSQFLVMADKFALVQPNTTTIKAPFVVTTVNRRAQLALAGDMIVDGTIQGRHIAAGQTIKAPNISGGSLNIGNGKFKVSNTGSVQINSAAGKVGLQLTNDSLRVYDESGQLVVEVGKLL